VLTVLTLAIGAAWAASLWRGFDVRAPGVRLGLSVYRGAFLVAWGRYAWVEDSLARAQGAEMYMDERSRFLFQESYRRELEARLDGALRGTLSDFDHPLWWVQRQAGARLPEFFPPYSSVVGGMAFPLWMATVVLAGPALFLWWPRVMGLLRRRAGACRKCGYDLAGLGEGARCPECGAARA
jgi:hypothetical protein